MFAHIKHAAIYTQNPGAMIAFYEKILGHEADHHCGDGSQSRPYQRRAHRAGRARKTSGNSRRLGSLRL